jgi:23S rRNA (guanosine2251-2'-O)-methyltransferase
VGSGGQGKRALRGRGPTPKAEDRPYHKAAKKAARAQSAAKPGGRSGAKPRQDRTKAERDLVMGRGPVLEALKAGVPAIDLRVATGPRPDERTREILQLAAGIGLPILEVTRQELERMSGGGAHQGVALRARPYRYATLEELLARARDEARPPLIVALDQITDPHNLGAVIRSAAAFGAHGVVIPDRRSAPVNATAWKVSAGTAARVPVARVTNLVRALGELRDQGLFVVGLDAQGAADVAHLELAEGPLVLVVGSEGKGLTRLVRETCDLTAAIPISGNAESLNASVAAGIALNEIAKARAAGPEA